MKFILSLKDIFTGNNSIVRKLVQYLRKELGLLAHQLLVLLKCTSPAASYEINVSDHKKYIYIVKKCLRS